MLPPKMFGDVNKEYVNSNFVHFDVNASGLRHMFDNQTVRVSRYISRGPTPCEIGGLEIGQIVTFMHRLIDI